MKTASTAVSRQKIEQQRVRPHQRVAPTWIVLILAFCALPVLSQTTPNPTFIKITQGPVVTDRANFALGQWADYDGDGLVDLLVPAGMDVLNQAPALYHNVDGDAANFVKLTTNEVDGVIGPRSYCYQGLWADFNNDGQLDLLEIGGAAVGTDAANRLFFGRSDHTFDWVTNAVGIQGTVASWMCALVDYDNDGLVDVLHTTGAWEEHYSLDSLYRNLGDGAFELAWQPTGGMVFSQFGIWSDYDNDGDMDLYLGTYGDPMQFYRNEGDGTFSEDLAGTEVPQTSSFYAAWGDYDNDGYQDLLTTRALYRNNRSGGFSRAATFPEGFCMWGDFDNDGDLDFVKGYWSSTPCRFYRNDGGDGFTQVDLGPPSHDVPAFESASTWCDYNNDGWLDLLVSTRGNPSSNNFLYRNAGLADGSTNHWLIVKPRGTTSNGAAIGAKVRVRATIRGADTWQLREVHGGGLDDLRAHFGLGDATTVTTLRIEWPSGLVQEFTDVPADQLLIVVEGRPMLSHSELASDGTFRFQLNGGLVDGSYVTESSLNLIQWTPVSTNAGPTTLVTVPQASGSAGSFLRVKEQ